MENYIIRFKDQIFITKQNKKKEQQYESFYREAVRFNDYYFIDIAYTTSIQQKYINYMFTAVINISFK